MNPMPKGADPYHDSDAPFAVWETRPNGRFLWVFHDEYLAMQCAVNNGLMVIPNPLEG